MKTLVLGHRGMLGHVVTQYLIDKGIEVDTTNHRWPSLEFKKRVKEYKGDYIINCIGAIPQKTSNFTLNYKLPIWLDINTQVKNVYCGTDSDDITSNYIQSKIKASNWIKKHSKKTKIIKSSIYGPELNTTHNIMEWFLSQKQDIDGYSNYLFNPNTTLTWSKWCYNLLNNWNSFETENILEGECISKYKLLKLLNSIFNKNINIKPVNQPSGSFCIQGNITTKSQKEQILELRSWIDENKSLYL